MTRQPENGYLLEKKLREEDPDLHQRVRDSVFVLQRMLSSFLTRFPNFTDHSLLHSMDVLNFCNQIIGPEQISKLCPEECYVLIMSCYLHDIGMGVSDGDYEQFSAQIAFADYFLTHDQADIARIVRDFHNELSGLFIRKYAALFDIPSEALLNAIVQVSRGHRKTDLFDEAEYPDVPVKNGVLRTRYLAAVLRLADEIDVASERNLELLFDTSRLTQKRDIEAFGTHESIRRVEVTEDSILLLIKPKSREYIPLIHELADKIQATLDYCREAAEKRSALRITQRRVVLEPWQGKED